MGNANMRGILLDDSGPILDDRAIAPCLQVTWRKTWDLNAALPADCPCTNSAGNLSSVWAYYQQKYPKDSFSLVSSEHDRVISLFFSYSLLACHNPVPVG